MRYRTKVTIVYLLGFFVDLINMFIANVAYPAIGHGLGASVSELSWVSNAYILGLTLVIPLSAWLAQRLGGRAVLLISLSSFLLATFGAGTAQSIGQLIGWRLLQGMGGGLLIPVGQTLTYPLYGRHERAALSAAIMLVGLLAPALSPAIGGVIVDSLSWRWVFFANLPLAFIALLLAAAWLQKEPRTTQPATLDFIGLASGCGALMLTLLGFTMLAQSGQMLSGIVLLVCAMVLFTGFVRHSLRHPQPLINLRLVKDPLLRNAMMIYQCIPGMFIGVSLIAMLWLQNLLNLSATRVGSLMVPWSIASLLAIMFTGKQFNRVGPRPILITGCLLQGLGILVLAQIHSANQYPLLLAAFAMMGFGGSLCSSTAQSCAFLQVADDQLGQASALWNINRQLSFCVGIALLSLLLNTLLEKLPPTTAYQWCFYLAATSTLFPALLCLRIANGAILRQLNAQKE
ncbi:multidrug efflux MFS transporter [Buttiauxella sp. B2]|uniref:MFS transporter n=1 Tax=Buttiauxella sp. B2 TaxID=2587812 RepID=UPI00111F9F07|nr:MFS transporter [Buttiauxella sp. B2]TNV13105.1 multidrug efflux MFS transporter [Buttiauxella sp. B2]